MVLRMVESSSYMDGIRFDLSERGQYEVSEVNEFVPAFFKVPHAPHTTHDLPLKLRAPVTQLCLRLSVL